MLKSIDPVTLGCISKASGPVAGTIVAAIIGAGGAVYSANEAADAQREAQDKADKARREAEERARQAAMDERPEGEEATLLPGAENDFEDTSGTYSDFLTPRTVTTLGGATTSGLTGGSSTGLGFNV